MKRNKVPIQVDPEFKELLKLEAKTKGMSMANLTSKLVNNHTEIDKIVKDWKNKFQSKTTKNKKRGFDFL